MNGEVLAVMLGLGIGLMPQNVGLGLGLGGCVLGLGLGLGLGLEGCPLSWPWGCGLQSSYISEIQLSFVRVSSNELGQCAR